MAFFKEVYCKNCGKKAGVLTNTKLADKSVICFDCARKVPTVFDDILSKMTYEEYLGLRDFKEYSDTNFKPIFNETDSYHDIHLDKDNGLFYIGSFLEDERVTVYECRNVMNADFSFVPDDVKKGIVNYKVKGKIVLHLVNSSPAFSDSFTLYKSAKAKAKTKLFSDSLEFEFPEDFEAFRKLFHYTVLISQSDEPASYEPVIDEELASALSLFMFDSLDGLDVDKLKKQRNRLAKAFHPDSTSESNDNEFMSKINNAYEVILRNLEGR